MREGDQVEVGERRRQGGQGSRLVGWLVTEGVNLSIVK